MLSDDNLNGRYPVAKVSRRTKYVKITRLHSVNNILFNLTARTRRVFVQVKRHGKQRPCRFNCSTLNEHIITPTWNNK